MGNNIIWAYNDDITKNTLFIHYEDGFFGISIVETKYSKRKKVMEYENILFKPETFQDFLMAFKIRKLDSYFSCSCLSEILRSTYEKDEKCFYLQVYDNYFLRYPRHIKDEICIPEEVADNLVKRLKGFYSPNLSKT